MRKVFVIVLAIVLIFCVSACFYDGNSFFYSDSVEIDEFDIKINKVANCCFVGRYNCIEYTENLEITIPDDYKGIPIKRIGGHYGRGLPTPFFISVADLYMNAPEGSLYHSAIVADESFFLKIPEDYVIEDIAFNLNIGKNIKVIDHVNMEHYFPHINDDGSITFYHPVVNINCSDENKHFYSKDGKLYNKKTDELISDFAYATP